VTIRKALRFATATALAALLVANAVVGASAADKIIIGFVPENIQDPGFRAVQRAMIRQLGDAGEIRGGDAQNSPEQQVIVVENLLAAGANCLIIRARNTNTLEPVAQRAAEAGVPVIGMFDSFGGADVVVGFNQRELGFSSGNLGGKFLQENFGGEGEVIVLNADSLGGATVDRADGIVEGIKAAAPNAVVVADVEAFTVEKGSEVVSAALQAYPNVRLIVTTNDAGARGALAALKNAGRAVPGETGIVAIAGEGTDETLQLIKRGEIYGTTSAALLEIGAKTVEVCQEMLAGQKERERIDFSPLPVLTKDNVDEQILKIKELGKIPVS
jgi:ribose transport system substrate-binding protein